MNDVGKVLCGAALLWVAGVNAMHAATTAGVADLSDPKRINACMAMSAEAVAKDTECTELMQTKNITVADMQTMKTCKSMKPDTMAQDATCATMTEKHPDMMQPPIQ
jgi:hypothetical protein